MKKVVIIGAGPAGVTAGYELLKNREDSKETYEVLILEQSDAIGGISRTGKQCACALLSLLGFFLTVNKLCQLICKNLLCLIKLCALPVIHLVDLL